MDLDVNVPPSVYGWGGGRKPFERWLNMFYDLVERDELLSPMFGGRVGEEHRRHATSWWCEVRGGPAEYTETRGGYEHVSLLDLSGVVRGQG